MDPLPVITPEVFRNTLCNLIYAQGGVVPIACNLLGGDTPKNGSWLNMAEMEISLLSRQCLGERRFTTAAAMDA